MRNIKHITYLILFLILTVRCSENIEPAVEKNSGVVLSMQPKNGKNGKTEALVYPSYYGTYNSGDIMNIKFDILTCGCDWVPEYVNIDLYKGSSRIGRIASNVIFIDDGYLGGYNWTVASMPTTGSDYKVRIINTSNSSEWAESGSFTLATPSSGCYYSHWKLTGAPGYYVTNNTTVQYKIVEDGLTSQTFANSPTMRIVSYLPINIVYGGVTYYSPGPAGVNIPIASSASCSGSNPIINAPLKFQRIGSVAGVGVIVTLNSVSAGHMSVTGYNSFSVY